MADVLVFACVGRDALAARVWDGLARLGLRDRRHLLAEHFLGWQGLENTQAGYRRRLRDFFATWRPRCVEYMQTRIMQDKMGAAAAAVRRGSLSERAPPPQGDDTRPRFSIPPTPADILNYFIFVEEERLRSQPPPRASRAPAEPLQPTVRPDSRSYATVARVGYARPVTRQDRDSTLQLPPIGGRGRAFMELPPKLQSIAPHAEGTIVDSTIALAGDTEIRLNGLRAHNRMFVLSQSWIRD